MAQHSELSGVAYDGAGDVIRLTINGIVVDVPRKRLAELRGIPKRYLAELEPGNLGQTLSLRRRDIDISISGLIEDFFGALVAAETGRRGGKARSPKKAAAAQRNGSLGGRPRVNR